MIVSDLEGAIFDCDGILVDSEQPWIDLMTSYLRNIGASHIPAEQLRGLTAAEAVTSLVEIHRSLGSPRMLPRLQPPRWTPPTAMRSRT